ncbi:MAG: DMT family transporter [Rhodoferax sp.]|nr:DMT family transporter [Rhodoferax sp.]
MAISRPSLRPDPVARRASNGSRLRRRAHASLRWRTRHLSPTARGLLWAVLTGVLFCLLNAVSRLLAQHLHPYQAQFLRYALALLVQLPWVWALGLAAYRPQHIGGQFMRGALHTAGLFMWYAALPHLALADTTAIGFTTPLFIMLGAYLFLREPMVWERWLATLVGFAGVMLVVGPRLSLDAGSGSFYHLLMLASAPLFAASFLLTKALTRQESAGTILLWQAISISLFSLPLAVWHWQAPTWLEWAGFLLCGAIGSLSHYCMTRSLMAADISATQSAKFLELIWSALLGMLIFSELPTAHTLAGGLLISAATLWVARRESRRPVRTSEEAPRP